ncbi:hypothetical protein ASPZODRAFT_74213 [Penicilliopsis zonata CBS 506.65]|uniref:Uncharacterized protein n=1 Tax=Penicilliopsis zonata CBS 506.65 TaxID=1073090 RepID=A0A1L9S8K8_9EURO|nr:hypothetical protein ASPZODRAFT_74213 [Penicilliopsis zonata CBS 506.65]OJJ43489.1 hypothetical protein ASPZODRAFT_74213 [Penicilliopsis zonata CBS 506.65]
MGDNLVKKIVFNIVFNKFKFLVILFSLYNILYISYFIVVYLNNILIFFKNINKHC